MSAYEFQTPIAGTSSQSGSAIAGVIGSSPAMQAVYEITRRVAPSNASVLLLGETGTGKELIAGAIHALSSRSYGPFVKVNCGALSESLLESELFGHVRGAFTSAVANRIGRFEAAHSGSIFLDEINSTSHILQVKLLRVLQEREFERVGDGSRITVDTRVIAASNRDLTKEVQEDRFREDLYWRLNVVPIVLPPLRKRPEDIPELVMHFLSVYSQANERHVVHAPQNTIDALQSYHWPGNVRELQNYVERAVVLAEGDEFSLDLLPDVVRHGGTGSPSTVSVRGVDLETLVQELVEQGVRAAENENKDIHSFVVNRVEKELIAQVLTNCKHVRTKAAASLGINRNTLHKKIKDYNLEAPEPDE